MTEHADRPPPDRSEGDVNISSLRRQWGERELDDATRELLDADERFFMHQALSTPCLDALRATNGSCLETLGGRRLLDFHGNSVHQVGYGHPRVIQAIKHQLDALPFCPRRYTNQTAVALARKLAELAPGNLNKVLLAPGGAEAVGIALKLMRLATGRYKTISWRDSFHGATLDTISIGGEAIFREGMGPLMPGAIHVPPPTAADTRADVEQIERIMREEGDVGAVVAEPVRCTAVCAPPEGYWRAVRALCDKHGALLIFDEIPICLGRTGRMFACEHEGVAPDILVIGKGLGGGVFPLAAIVAREDLDVAGHAALGHYTHEKSPVGAAAALAAIEVIEEEGLVERARALGESTLARLHAMMGRHPLMADVRGLGLLIGIELLRGGEPAADEAEAVMYEALSRGLSFKVSCGNVLTLTPPLTISDAEMDEALGILDESLGAVERH